MPKVACRNPGLPRGLQPGQVEAMLASCDRTSGRFARPRDADLVGAGRATPREVAALGLDDIDWRSGELVVTGKGRRTDRLPLVGDAGAAIVDYLQHGRPADALDRRVFIRIRAPHTGLTATGVTQAVAAAAGRAGLGTVYAHRLRHSAATSMLAAGASLTEIGQVLRHRGPLTTSIYAKADTTRLQALARPWPTAVRDDRRAACGACRLPRVAARLGYGLMRDEKLLTSSSTGSTITTATDHGRGRAGLGAVAGGRER